MILLENYWIILKRCALIKGNLREKNNFNFWIRDLSHFRIQKLGDFRIQIWDITEYKYS